jgi:hypothetical protein
MLAALTDLVAIGALPGGVSDLEKYGVRGTRLIELASAQVCAYLRTTEVLLLAAITSEQATSLAAIVAEAAGSRLNVSAAPSSNPYEVAGTPSNAMLNRWHFRQIDALIGRAGQGSVSVSVARDTDSSGAYTWSPEYLLGVSYGLGSGGWWPA